LESPPTQEQTVTLLEKVTLRHELFQSISYRLGESRFKTILFKKVAERYWRYGSSLLKQKFQKEWTLAFTSPDKTLRLFTQEVFSSSDIFNEMLSLVALSAGISFPCEILLACTLILGSLLNFYN
jgi:hypothetical protein